MEILMYGKFITIEGTDGSGKTTIIKYIEQYLIEKGYNVVITREPGGTEVSEKIRDILLNFNVDAKTEALLFAASRREHILNKILPELEKGSIVLCDRFLDSSIAYQGYGRNLKIDDIIDINNYILESLMPDVTLYFDVDINLGISRTKKRDDNNRLDSEKIDFYTRIKEGYDNIAKNNSDRVITINANKNLEDVKRQSIEIIEGLIEKWK